jgi:voltage-gated potassium channel
MPAGIRKLFYAIIILIISLMLGTIGFYYVEDYNLIDSFFMAVITISTVGYATVNPLDNAGKLFVSLYIIFNLMIFAYVISVITSYLFEGGLINIFRNFKIDREINKMKNHVIVCGYGRNGSKACEELAFNHRKYIIIENDESLIANIQDNGYGHLIVGDATDEETLRVAKIDKADYIITTLPKDTDNVFITLTAREINPDIKVIARASDLRSEKKLMRAGATNIVMPDALGGIHMAQLITKPYVIEFLDLLNGITTEKIHLEEIVFDDLKPEYQNKTISELHIRGKSGVSIIGMKRGEKGFSFNPGPDTVINEESVIIILGNDQQLENFSDLYLRKKIVS